MKLSSIDDLLAEIGLGNAMSVVVAKNLLQSGSEPSSGSSKRSKSCRSRALMAY